MSDEVFHAELERINGKLDRLDEAMRGNGKPGVNTRLDRLERNSSIQSRLMWLVITAVLFSLAGTVITGIA